MSKIKMRDVFNLPVSVEEVADIGVEDFVLGEDEMAAYAINNHDRMVEEIAELQAALELMILQFESDHNCEYEYKVIKSSKNLLAKLNQEGEE